MAFETFTRKHHNRPDERPTVTVTARSGLAMNAAAWHALGEPNAVTLLWDSDSRTVGMRAGNRSDPDTYAVGPNSHYVGSSAFTRWADLPTARRFLAEMRDGVLCFDLDGESVPVTSNRAKANDDA